VAGNELEKALRTLQAQDIRGLILDLRDNPGGLLSEACDVADKFLEKGQLIVSTKGRQADQDRDYLAQTDPALATDIPLVVLVTQGSASASEIVAGAIQDHDRGLILGQPTFGKGSVQTVHLIDETARLKLTTAHYYTPSGRSIHRSEGDHLNGGPDSTALEQRFFTDHGRAVYGGGGILPDIEVENIPLTRLTRALRRERLFLDFAVHYAVVHPDINESFEVDDEVLVEFEGYLSSPEGGFEYPFAGQSQIQELEEMVEEEGYGEDVKSALAALKSALQKQKKTDFNQSRDYTRMALRSHIASRMWGSEARIRATFPEDRQLQKALELLRDPALYTRKMEETSVAIGK
jgi:carboxyl-terminal processing protease